MTSDEYCREIESYLCRKNDGHLIRIVGPSFERVCGWAAQGIPFKIVCQGIDAYFVRYYAKGVRRRPVQIDFCEHDILDAFDAWRRAVGVRMPGTGETDAEAQVRRSKRSLPEHLDRVCERVTARRAGMTHAAEATNKATNATETNVGASFGLTPSRNGVRRREAPDAASIPMTSPVVVSTMPCRAMSLTTEPGVAPTATRTPISRVRLLTA